MAGRFLVILFLVGMLWFVYAILTLTLEAHPNNNLNYIPDDAITVYRVDGRTLAKEFIASALIHQDEDLESLLFNALPETPDGKMKPLGISFDSDILRFETIRKKDTLSGWLFNLYSAHLFKKNVPEYIDENTVIAANDGVAIVLSGATVRNTQQWKDYALQLVSTKTKFAEKHLNEREGFASSWQRTTNGNSGFFAVNIEEHAIQLSGNLKLSGVATSQAFDLKPDGFHIESRYVPAEWNDFLSEYLTSIGLELPKINGFSLNYFGTLIVSEPEFNALPKANMQIAFDEPISLDSLFKGKFAYTKGPKTRFRLIQLYDQTYYVAAKGNLLEMYIDPPKSTEKSGTALIRISGKPLHLMTVEGDALIRRLMNLSPLMNATRLFTSSIQDVNIEVKKNTGNSYTLEGTVQLDEDEWPANAITKYLLRSQLFQ